jgi:hypothetical protein
MFARKEYFLFSLFNPSVAFSKIKLNWGMSAVRLGGVSSPVSVAKYSAHSGKVSRIIMDFLWIF